MREGWSEGAKPGNPLVQHNVMFIMITVILITHCIIFTLYLCRSFRRFLLPDKFLKDNCGRNCSKKCRASSYRGLFILWIF